MPNAGGKLKGYSSVLARSALAAVVICVGVGVGVGCTDGATPNCAGDAGCGPGLEAGPDGTFKGETFDSGREGGNDSGTIHDDSGKIPTDTGSGQDSGGQDSGGQDSGGKDAGPTGDAGPTVDSTTPPLDSSADSGEASADAATKG